MLSEEYEVASESNAEYTAEVVVEELQYIRKAEQFQVAVLMVVLLLVVCKEIQNFFINIF